MGGEGEGQEGTMKDGKDERSKKGGCEWKECRERADDRKKDGMKESNNNGKEEKKRGRSKK